MAALAQVALILVKNNFPNLTQGLVVDQINEYLASSLATSKKSKSIPCKPIVYDSRPAVQHNYTDFTSSRSTEVIRLFNSYVGGDPVNAGSFGLNAWVDYALNYTMANGLSPIALTKVPGTTSGSWEAKSLFYFASADDKNSMEISNFRIIKIKLLKIN